MRTAPSPLPLTSPYPQNCTPPTKSSYMSQLPSAYGGVGTAKVPTDAAAPENMALGSTPEGVRWGWEIAQRMSMVITHCPVVRSHWRSVLSEAPVTCERMSMELGADRMAYETLVLEVERRHRLRVALQHPRTAVVPLRLRRALLTISYPAPRRSLLPIRTRPALAPLALLRNLTQRDHLALALPAPPVRRVRVRLRIDAPQVPQPHVPVRAAREAHVVLHLHALDAVRVPAQAPDLRAREEVPHARLRVVLRRAHERAVRLGEVERGDARRVAVEGLLELGE